LTEKIKAHKDFISSIAWKPMHLDKDCKQFLTASKDGIVKIWNGLTGASINTFSAHLDAITKAVWSGENFIYTCSRDKSIKIWQENGIPVHVLSGHAHWVNTMTLNSEYIIRTACNDEKKKSFKNKSEMHSYALERYKKFKESISNEEINGEKLVSGSDDFTLILWDPLGSEKPICRMTGHQNLVNQVQFSPNSLYLASASFDKCIKIWNGHNGNFLFNFRGHVGPVYQIAWSADSRMIVSGSKDSTLKCWNVNNKRLMFDLPGHADEIYCVDWSPDGERAASGSKDRRIRIWKN
jgi:ribosome assembly protein 4